MAADREGGLVLHGPPFLRLLSLHLGVLLLQVLEFLGVGLSSSVWPVDRVVTGGGIRHLQQDCNMLVIPWLWKKHFCISINNEVHINVHNTAVHHSKDAHVDTVIKHNDYIEED